MATQCICLLIWVMAHSINKLSARFVQTTQKSGKVADGGGLYLQVSKTGSKSWIFRFMLNGCAREMGLGSLNRVSLAQLSKLFISEAKAPNSAQASQPEKWAAISDPNHRENYTMGRRTHDGPLGGFHPAVSSSLSARKHTEIPPRNTNQVDLF